MEFCGFFFVEVKGFVVESLVYGIVSKEESRDDMKICWKGNKRLLFFMIMTFFLILFFREVNNGVMGEIYGGFLIWFFSGEI